MGTSEDGTAESEWHLPDSKELREAYIKSQDTTLDRLEWKDLGLCGGMSTENFYSAYEESTTHAKAIDELCGRCIVQKVCQSVGKSKNEYGVWGGIYWNGKGEPDRRYNKHKDTE